eukprot:377673-Rhodomonas_salina.2
MSVPPPLGCNGRHTTAGIIPMSVLPPFRCDGRHTPFVSTPAVKVLRPAYALTAAARVELVPPPIRCYGQAYTRSVPAPDQVAG